MNADYLKFQVIHPLTEIRALGGVDLVFKGNAIYVEDPDAAWSQAIEAGATPLYEVIDHDYGERSGGVIDPCGNRWFFAAVTDQQKRSS